MKKIIVFGENSYIGKSFKTFTENKFDIKPVNSREGVWKNVDFSGYDCVLYCAGIAHLKQKKNMKPLYYKINCDLAVEVAEKAKAEGIRQFIFLSSMSVYGSKNEEIGIETVLNPDGFYGESKLMAERELKKSEDENFVICIVRPPMVYGKECAGNFKRLVKLAEIMPVFPDYQNKRSMIYIDNLCDFLCGIIDGNESGTYLPQNDDYVSTTELVRYISKIKGKKIIFTKLFNPLISLLSKRVKTLDKMFGNLRYIKSDIKTNYDVITFEESVKRSI